ncbi:hypothetical protein [Cystobacter ferrugineus]|uniref:Uncharacterized protein n=1 Tax=Cystobacter ferrugineus TaxID=83449 RepID=A0A1L9BFS1_9BACT|nr:hypothetical protein [Cystobacter ferrugineus]OJH41111.1 hypothetical protein BON30_09445 [Cystobacter ferrugineus]
MRPALADTHAALLCSREESRRTASFPDGAEAGEVKLRLTGTYEQGKTWYMAQGAIPKDEPA